MRFAGYACFLVRDVVWCQSDANSVQIRLTKVRSVQFACLIKPTVSSFSSIRVTATKGLRSVRSVQFIQFSSRAPPALIWRPCVELKGTSVGRSDNHPSVSVCLNSCKSVIDVREYSDSLRMCTIGLECIESRESSANRSAGVGISLSARKSLFGLKGPLLGLVSPTETTKKMGLVPPKME